MKPLCAPKKKSLGWQMPFQNHLVDRTRLNRSSGGISHPQTCAPPDEPGRALGRRVAPPGVDHGPHHLRVHLGRRQDSSILGARYKRRPQIIHLSQAGSAFECQLFSLGGGGANIVFQRFPSPPPPKRRRRSIAIGSWLVDLGCR